MAGCGKVEEPVPVDLSSANMEELEEETSEYVDAAGETEQPGTENDNSEKEGNFADLQEGISVIIQGNWQDDDSFRADSIVMSSFE